MSRLISVSKLKRRIIGCVASTDARLDPLFSADYTYGMKRFALFLPLIFTCGCSSIQNPIPGSKSPLTPVDGNSIVLHRAEADGSLNLLRLSVSSDPHWGSPRADPGKRSATIDSIAGAVPRKDALILLGDISDAGGAWWQPKAAARELASRLNGIPVVAIPGNHDSWFGGLRYFGQYFGNAARETGSAYSPCFSLEAGDALLVFLNLPWSSKTFTPSQRTWLGGILESAKSARKPVIVFSHSFFYSSGITEFVGGVRWFDNQENIGALEPVFREYGVKLVVSGHNHYMELLESGGVTYAVAGAMGGHHDPVPTYVSPASLWFSRDSFGYLDLDIGDGKITMRFMDSGGTELKENSIPYQVGLPNMSSSAADVRAKTSSKVPMPSTFTTP